MIGITWDEMIATYKFKDKSDVITFLENIETDPLIELYRDILKKLRYYPSVKKLFDKELEERDLREYICPDYDWIHRGYTLPKNLPDNILFEVVCAKDGMDLAKRCEGYVSFLPAEAMCLAFFYAFCIGREDLLPGAKDYVETIDTYTPTLKKFLNDHAAEEYITHVRAMRDEIKAKYRK